MDQEDYMTNYGGGADDSPENPSTTTRAAIDPTIPIDPTDPTLPARDPTIIDPTAVDPTEVAVKARRPQVKLTAEKLMSPKGLPYVMKKAPKVIRISNSRRSAHDNLSKIIMFYHVWAHSLFPKAKFRDFVKLCNTLGKNDSVLREYRMNLFRADMGIDPVGESTQVPDQGGDLDTMDADEGDDAMDAGTGTPSLFVNQQSIDPVRSAHDANSNGQSGSAVRDGNLDDEEDEDEDDDLFAMSALHSKNIIPSEMRGDTGTQIQSVANTTTSQTSAGSYINEMDALMRDMAGLTGAPGNGLATTRPNQENNEADMYEMEEEMMRSTPATTQRNVVPTASTTAEQQSMADYDDDEEAMLEMMREQESNVGSKSKEKSVAPHGSNSGASETDVVAPLGRSGESSTVVSAHAAQNATDAVEKSSPETTVQAGKGASFDRPAKSDETQTSLATEVTSPTEQTQPDEINSDSIKLTQNTEPTAGDAAKEASPEEQLKTKEDFMEETMNAMDQYGF